MNLFLIWLKTFTFIQDILLGMVFGVVWYIAYLVVKRYTRSSQQVAKKNITDNSSLIV